MHALEQSQSGNTGLDKGAAFKVEDDVVSKATKFCKGHIVKTTPSLAPIVKKEVVTPSSDFSHGQRPIHEQTRLHSSRLTSIKVDSADFLRKPDPQRAEQIPSSSRQHKQRAMPHSTICKPDDKTTQELKAKLKQSAGIPRSAYQRQFPNLAGCDTLSGDNVLELENIRDTVKDIMNRYQLLNDREFKEYLKSRKLSKEMFNSEGFMWKIPQNLLKVVVNYTFREDPILRNISFTGKYGYALSYCDHEILKEHEAIRCELIRGVEIKYTHNEKPIIQQQATRGCTYAAAAMLMHQHDCTFSADELKSRNLGNDEIIVKDLSDAGLSPFKTSFSTLAELADAVSQAGSAIVTVNSTGGGHNVIVDAVTDKCVLIRDPYHGWEVEICRYAFEVSWEKDAIQVK